VHHKAKDTHHGGTAVVQFDSTLADLGLWAKFVPAKVDESVTEVSRELSLACNVPHDEQLQKTDEGDDLSKTGLGDSIRSTDGGQTIGVGAEGVTGQVDVSWQVKTGTCRDLAQECQHTDPAVLQFNITKTFELGLVTVRDKSKRVVETIEIIKIDLVMVFPRDQTDSIDRYERRGEIEEMEG